MTLRHLPFLSTTLFHNKTSRREWNNRNKLLERQGGKSSLFYIQISSDTCTINNSYQNSNKVLAVSSFTASHRRIKTKSKMKNQRWYLQGHEYPPGRHGTFASLFSPNSSYFTLRQAAMRIQSISEGNQEPRIAEICFLKGIY